MKQHSHFGVLCAAMVAGLSTQTALAQTTRVNPVLALHPSDVTQQEQLNSLMQQVAQLKAQLAADEAKLKSTTETANNAKLAVALVNNGYDKQFKNMADMQTKLASDLSGLRQIYLVHTHGYAKRVVGFTNVSVGGTYASLIQKNVDSFEATTPPK